jgi:teichuronic acid exporter
MIFNFRKRLQHSAYWRDILWQASGNSLAQVIGVLGMPLLTRLYSPQDFALQNLFLQVVGLATGVMTWRYEYLIQLPKKDDDSKLLLYLVLLLGFIVFVISTPLIWVFRFKISSLLGDLALAPWLGIAPLTGLLICYALALQHRVQRRKGYRQSGLAELVNKSAYVGYGIVNGCFSGGPSGLIAATGVSALGKIVWLSKIDLRKRFSQKNYTTTNLDKSLSLSLKDMWRLAQAYVHLSASMVFSHLMMTFTTAIPAIFIAHTYGGKALGQFTLVFSTLYLPAGLIGAAIGQVYYQRAAESWASGETFAPLWRMTAKRLLVIGIPIYSGIALVSSWAYPLIFGKIWTDAGRYATIMTVSALFSFVSSPLDRSSLVVDAWWYLPIWHLLRVITILCVTCVTWLNRLEFDVFLILLVMQMSLMYAIDFWAEWRFSLRDPKVAY